MNPPSKIPNAPKTIDLLILSTLAQGGTYTAEDISEMWGEDVTRVREWLNKFRKQGLCVVRVLAGNRIGFHGHEASIMAHIERNKSRYA